MKPNVVSISLIILTLLVYSSLGCQNPCYSARFDQNCPSQPSDHQSYTMHMSVHPHLDAYWIFTLDSYYDPQPSQGQVHSYFRQNRFNSVKQIFDTITRVLRQSKMHRQMYGQGSQKAHRSFFNSQMGFFKKWYQQQDQRVKKDVKELLGTKYWEILGGGFVQHDQGCAYYDDIIQNFQTGLHFLKEQFNYFPKVAVSADSFGHSQTTLAILAHLGIQGFFVQRSDQHILLQNKTQFIWKAKSSNGQYYGALPTHIRWAIHGFEDQFIGSNPNQNLCQTKQNYIGNMRRQNQFLKRILKSPHIMRYFGHDFQQFDNYSYSVIQAIMQKFSSQKCNRITAVYGNPTQYFMTLMGQVFGQKKKPIATRQQDIMPIWDYDSGLYWTGYYTTDPYHKKNYRDMGRFLYTVRKFMVPSFFIKNGTSNQKQQYETLEKLAEQVAYLQHHDGISGTSKYNVMDILQIQNEKLKNTVLDTTVKRLFDEEFESGEPIERQTCQFGQNCKIKDTQAASIYLRVFNSAGYKRLNQPLIIALPYNILYSASCPFQTNCLCQQLPCQCSLYLYPQTYSTYLNIKLTKVASSPTSTLKPLLQIPQNKMFSYNQSHFKISLNNKKYSIGYKKIIAQGTNRNYQHLSRFGDHNGRGFNIRSGKYALGNNPNKINDFSTIRNVLMLESQRTILLLIKWNRQQMKTLISISKQSLNQWKVQTLSAAQAYQISDLYLQVQTQIKNQNKFFTDSNGWLVMKRELFHHQDYKAHFDNNKYDDIDGNSYPMTAFCFIQDVNQKVSINTDRPQGIISYKQGRIWINFDRLSSDDGKWVWQNTYRSDYQRFTHIITVQNKNNNQRKIQMLYDMPVISQLYYSKMIDIAVEKTDIQMLQEWTKFSGLRQLKTLVKPINDTTLLVRIHNLNDQQHKQVKLFVGNVSPLLTAFYGNKVTTSKVQERALGNNMNYQQFLDKKWNWNNVVSLEKENTIFNKEFGQSITLRPLQIRTFLFYDVNFEEKCEHSPKLTTSNSNIKYSININKAAPKRQDPLWQKDVTNYMLNGDHCSQKSPISIDKKYLVVKEQTHQNLPDGVVPHKPNPPVFNKDDIVSPVKIDDKKSTQPKKEPKKQQPKHIQQPKDTQKPKPIQSNKQQLTKQPKKQQPENPKKGEQKVSAVEIRQKAEFLQIRQKIQKLSPLTRAQKKLYFNIRVKQIQDMLKSIEKSKTKN